MLENNKGLTYINVKEPFSRFSYINIVFGNTTQDFYQLPLIELGVLLTKNYSIREKSKSNHSTAFNLVKSIQTLYEIKFNPGYTQNLTLESLRNIYFEEGPPQSN